MLIELLRFSGGGGAVLARRWVAALLSVPADERRELVEEVEARIAEVYDVPRTTLGTDDPEQTMLHVAQEPIQKPGYVQQVIRSYAASTAPKKKAKAAQRRQKPSA